jgi:predicted Rossmann fold nucleotide-binding protein DprA/Smf involved in DNA uptake
MYIGVVGNRKGWTFARIKEVLDAMKLNKKLDVIVSGGAEGVDYDAQLYAEYYGFEIHICYPDPERPSPERYFERNLDIARKSDILIAFNIKSSGRTGTANTIRHARNLGKTVYIIDNPMLKEAFNVKEVRNA